MEIVTGYNRKSKNLKSGIAKIWIAKFVPYSRSQVVISGNELVSFPSSFEFLFEAQQGITASETMAQNEGGKYYDQSIGLVFAGSELGNLAKLQEIDVRILVLRNSGDYKLFGLVNGLQSSGLTYTTGSSKPELNGYTLTFEGKEKDESPFITMTQEALDYTLNFELNG